MLTQLLLFPVDDADDISMVPAEDPLTTPTGDDTAEQTQAPTEVFKGKKWITVALATLTDTFYEQMDGAGKQEDAASSPTRTLVVSGFTRPLLISAVEGLMSTYGKFTTLWMNKIKTHCFVTVRSLLRDRCFVKW